MMEKIVAPLSHYKKILKDFPRNMMFCFAYGSGAFKQKIDPSKNMLDLVFVVRNSNRWHAENIRRNPHHYSLPMRLMGHRLVTNFQDNGGAKIYYNTLIKSSDGRLIKYGVVSEISFVEDLLDWNVLYLAGRLHKPVQILVEPDENSHIGNALVRNLHSAVHAALLLLPEHFTEIDFYKCIAGLSYTGDFRMTFGEDRNKIDNIVKPQIGAFRELYAPILRQFDKYIDIPKSDSAAVDCHQDTSPSARIYHLNQLPRKPQIELVRSWSHGPRSKDTEDCLHAIAHDPDCSELLERSLHEIVWRSSVSQSLKGIVTAGFVKTFKYGGAKIMKMISSSYAASKDTSSDTIKQITSSASKNDKVHKIVDNVVKKNTMDKDITK